MPTSITYANTDPNYNNSYARAVAITPNDSIDLAEVTRAINVHKSGSTSIALKVTLQGDTTPVTLNLVSASVTPIIAKRIWATGTDATSVIALY